MAKVFSEFRDCLTHFPLERLFICPIVFVLYLPQQALRFFHQLSFSFSFTAIPVLSGGIELLE